MIRKIDLKVNSSTAVTYCIIRPRRSRSAAAYSRQTFPWTICRSVGPSVGLSVGMTSALWQNGGSDPDAVWHHKSDGPGMRQVVGLGDRSTGRDTFRGEFGARYCNPWGLYAVGDVSASTVGAAASWWCVRWAEALLYYMGSTSCKGKGRFSRGFCSPFSQWEMPLGRRR